MKEILEKRGPLRPSASHWCGRACTDARLLRRRERVALAIEVEPQGAALEAVILGLLGRAPCDAPMRAVLAFLRKGYSCLPEDDLLRRLLTTGGGRTREFVVRDTFDRLARSLDAEEIKLAVALGLPQVAPELLAVRRRGAMAEYLWRRSRTAMGLQMRR